MAQYRPVNHNCAQKLAEKHGLALDGVVLSNGTLITAEMIQQLRSAGLRLMISMDGVGSWHDCQRHYADGRGSFADVARAIEIARTGGLKPIVSITVSGRNIEGLPEVVAWVLNRDLPFNLNLYRENDCAACHAGLNLESEHIIAGMLSAYKVIEDNLLRRSLLTSLADRANFNAPHLRTCSVGQSYLVFDTQGRVSKCQMDMVHPITDCNDRDPLGTVQAHTTGLQNPPVDEKSECSECEWRYWCGGGCPLLTHRVSGGFNVKSPNCTIYKTLFPEVIRLEGLRLKKYAEAL